MKYFSFLVYLVAFIACHDDHHTEPELPQGQWTESHPFKGIPRTGGVSFTIGDVAYVGLGRTLPTATEALKDFWYDKVTTKKRNAERYSDRIELQGFQSCFRLFVKPSQSPLKPNQDAATLLVRNHARNGDKRTRITKQGVKD